MSLRLGSFGQRAKDVVGWRRVADNRGHETSLRPHPVTRARIINIC